MNPYTQALAELTAIETLIKDEPGGYPAPELVQQVRRHLSRIQWSGAKGDVAMKVGSIEGHLDRLYSHRKHQSYARGNVTGAEFVRHLLMTDLYVLRWILHEGEDRAKGERS